MFKLIHKLLILCVFSFLMISCGANYTIPLIEEAPKYGFVPEMDEPSTRGQLSKITPTDMYIKWKYAIAPNGESIVFSGKHIGLNEPFQLYRLDFGSKAPVKITSGGSDNVWDPSFTKDGNSIVYRTGNTFWKINKNGSGARVKVPGSGLGNRDLYPDVSSNDKVVFVTYDPYTFKYLIWTTNLDGSELTQYREGNHPTWSPDGSKIAFEYYGDIWIMTIAGTELTQLTSTEDINENLPSFSNDGNHIIYAANENAQGKTEKDINIWSIQINGTNKTQITELKSWDSWPVWSESGVYFLSGRAKGDKEVIRIWRMKLFDNR